MAFDALSPLDDELPLSRVIADRLAAAIIEGLIPANMKLTEEELARRFKTSRTPVREALRLLELEALITFEPRKGVRVRRVTAEDTAELYLLRGHLGGLAARLAAENATPSDVERLRELQTDLEDSLRSRDLEHYARCVITYDDVLVTIAKNRLLNELLERLHRQSMRVTIMLTLPEPLFAQATEVRSRMLEAIATHKPDRAEQAMRELNQMTWNALAERGLPRANPDTPAQVEQIAAHRADDEGLERDR